MSTIDFIQNVKALLCVLSNVFLTTGLFLEMKMLRFKKLTSLLQVTQLMQNQDEIQGKWAGV